MFLEGGAWGPTCPYMKALPKLNVHELALLQGKLQKCGVVCKFSQMLEIFLLLQTTIGLIFVLALDASGFECCL